MGQVRAISYGGGVQSTALLVLAAQREIDFPLALFANVGDDSEHPATLRYVEEVAKPYAAAHGLELVELQKQRREGGTDSVRCRLERTKASIGIPVRMSNGAPGNRTCTIDFKIKPIAKELKRRGATALEPATVALGISVDEYQRMRSESGIPHELLTYPLIDLRLSRQDCMNIIGWAGLPVPPKSSCYFCPFHDKRAWRTMLRDEPELFAKSVELERFINARRARLGRDQVWLTAEGKPLDEAITETGQLEMFDDGATCDIGGYCHA
jgi:hypothetical protein